MANTHIIIITTILLILLVTPLTARASFGSSLAGRILLDVERNGEAWYVYPKDSRRYFLGRPADAFALMRRLGLGVSEYNFQRVAQAGMPVEGDRAFARSLAGMIILQVEQNGEAWYVHPETLKKHYLGRPADAFRVMREQGLGITSLDLARVHKPGTFESIDKYSYYYHKRIETVSGSHLVEMVVIDLNDPGLKIITDTTGLHPAPDNDKYEGYYSAQSVGKFVLDNSGFAGINGTYFCSSSNCESLNYYFFPVYDTSLGKMVNGHQLKYPTTGPIFAFDTDNNFYYFKDSRDFASVDYFEKITGKKLQAAIGNKPRLVEEGMNLLIDWELDDKQRYIKATRNAFGYKSDIDVGDKGDIYLIVARDATVPELADIMKALGVDYALNLDGGYSSALWYNDEYMAGPGRDVPNSIVFAK